MDAEPVVAIGTASDQGRRRNQNEDSVAIPPPNLSVEELSAKGVLCLVADGIGGHKAGKSASELVARRVMEEYYGQPPGDVAGALRRAIRVANTDVFRLAQEPGYEKMGTTIVAAVLHGQTLTVAHVGDSRAYLLSPEQAQLLTRDHTWVTEQIEEGILTQEQADKHAQRHVLTRSLGARPEVLIDVIHTSLRPGDQVLLCSDGLWETVGLGEIEAAARGASPQQAATRLVELANEYGGPDNVTVVLARPDLGPLSPALPVARPGAAGRLGRTVTRILPAGGSARWPLLAAAAVVMVLAVAGALALVLGGIPREAAATPTAASTTTQVVEAGTPLPGPAATVSPGTAPTAPAAVTAPTIFPGKVVATLPLALRQEPQLAGALIGYLDSGATVAVSCRTTGDAVDGDDIWYRVTVEGPNTGYVAARWIELQGAERGTIPACQN